MFFATASHNSLFLPVISKNHTELSNEFVSLNGEKVVLDKNITVLGFPGSNIEEVKANLEMRDYIDSHREVSPLQKATDAIVIDNTDITPQQQLQVALKYVRMKQ